MLSRCVRSLAVPLAAMLFTACSIAAPALPSPAPSSTSSELESRDPSLQTSCNDECAAAGARCPAECGASIQECAAATQTCFDSCARGVGPWLPC